jgi:putative two-component system response regulator
VTSFSCAQLAKLEMPKMPVTVGIPVTPSADEADETEIGHLLIVDDQPNSRLLLGDLLESIGYRVSEAESGNQALQMLKTFQPDLILLDVMMPGLDGFEVCRRIKANDETRLIPVVLVTAASDHKNRVRGIEAGADDFLSKPFDESELLARVRSLVRQKHLNEDLDHAAQVLFAIARSVESRDPTTGDHCERLAQMAKSFGEFLHLPRPLIKVLMWGGYLHDIGKVGIPDAILGKTGKHTPEEWEVMKSHVLIGEQICRPLRTMKEVLPLIRHHHERWDGSGYPDGLKGEEIPLVARIFQIIDIYDALTSERPYKRAFTVQEAISILREETDRGWRDPQLVEYFFEFLRSRALDLE